MQLCGFGGEAFEIPRRTKELGIPASHIHRVRELLTHGHNIPWVAGEILRGLSGIITFENIVHCKHVRTREIKGVLHFTCRMLLGNKQCVETPEARFHEG